MSRRPTPWQRGCSARTSRGLVTKVVQSSLVLIVFSLFFGAAPISADTASITYTIAGFPGTNGWFKGSAGGDYVVVHWTVNVPVDQIQSSSGCEVGGARVDGPTTITGTTKTCTVTLIDNSQLSKTTSPIKIDNQPPTGLVVSAARPPDANGWYNHPLAINWSGTDATSGVAACTSLTYSGPDSGTADVSGGCTDVAGNSSSTLFAFRYDATPPQLSSVSVQSTDGANIVHWKSSSTDDVAAISRIARGNKNERSLFSGVGTGFVDKKIQAGVEYRYAVRTYDQAGNASKPRIVLALPKVVSLGKIGYTPRAAALPILSWPAKRGAAYYHIQLFRNGKRILAAWPLTTQLALHARWRWAGKRYRLAPAQYTWFAWAGFGSRAAARYKLIGHATFIVPAR
jgi:hypothetical protein